MKKQDRLHKSSMKRAINECKKRKAVRTAKSAKIIENAIISLQMTAIRRNFEEFTIFFVCARMV